MSELQYHQSIFTLLGVEPVVSAERQATIAERERVCGVTFPAAVKELMSIEGMEMLFFENTNNDFLPSVGGEIKGMRDYVLGHPVTTNAGFLLVANENQGVVAWYVRLDEGDDPPVYHDNGGLHGEDDENWPEGIEWEQFADTYSSFIYQMVAPRDSVYLTASDRAPNLDEHERLGERFVEALTGTPIRQWILPNPETHVVPLARIELHPLSATGDKAMWILTADSPDALKSLLDGVRDIANLAQTLETQSEEANQILRTFRAS